MKVSSWTKSEIASDFAGCKTLREVIIEIENRGAVQGEVVCEIRVNGMTFSENDEAEFGESAADTIDAIDAIEVKTNRPIDLVSDALKSAIGLMPQLEKSALTTAELIRAGEAARAAKNFSETIEGCQWLVETLHHVKGASAGIGLKLASSDAWDESAKLIGRVVSEVSDAHGRADSILVADLLEYEMTAALASWKTTIESELDRSPEP